MKTLKLTTAQELKKVCTEKSVVMPESEKSWSRIRPDDFRLNHTKRRGQTINVDFEEIPAYDQSELLEWLPCPCGLDNGDKYKAFFYGDYDSWFRDKKPQEALAKLAIYLVSNGHLK